MKTTIESIVHQLLAEDLSNHSNTYDPLLHDYETEAVFITEEGCVISGIKIIQEMIHQFDDTLYLKVLNNDGSYVDKGTIIAILQGRISSIIRIEQLCINLLRHLSGIATMTNQYVEQTSHSNAKICDTRDTIPNARFLEQLAIIDGGGVTHRTTYDQQYIISTHHISNKQSIKDLVNHAKRNIDHNVRIEVEVHTYNQFIDAEQSDCDIIVLCDFNIESARKCILSNHSNKLIIGMGAYELQDIHSLSNTGIHFIAIRDLIMNSKAIMIQMKYNN